MTHTNKILIFSLLTGLIGLAAGAVFGVMAGSRLGSSMIVQDWVNTNADRSLEMIVALKEVRSGEEVAGLDKLEVQLNKLMIGLSESYIDGFDLNKDTLARIEQIRDSARRYREQYPRPESPDILERQIIFFLAEKPRDD